MMCSKVRLGIKQADYGLVTESRCLERVLSSTCSGGLMNKTVPALCVKTLWGELNCFIIKAFDPRKIKSQSPSIATPSIFPRTLSPSAFSSRTQIVPFGGGGVKLSLGFIHSVAFKWSHASICMLSPFDSHLRCPIIRDGMEQDRVSTPLFFHA